MAGVFSNPANWEWVDMLQGQKPGFTLFGDMNRAANSLTSPALAPSGTAGIGSSNPTGTEVLGYSTTSQPKGNLADPTQDQTQSGATGGATGSTGGSTRPAYSQADLDALNEQERLYRALFGTADSTLDSGIRNLDNTLTSERNKANTSYGRATSGYDQKEYDTKNSMQGTMNTAKTNSRMLADSVRRILGLAGAAGSTAMSDAGQAIKMDMTGKENAVMGDYGQNLGLLKKARDNSKTDFEALLAELQGQRQTGEQNLRAGVEQQKQGLQRSLDEIATERTRLMGGNQLPNMQTMTNNYLDYQNKINALPSQFTPSIKAREVKADPVSLKDYFVGQTNLGQNQRSGNYSPYAEMLAKRQKPEDEEQQLTY